MRDYKTGDGSLSYTTDGNNLASVTDANGVTVTYGTPDSLDRNTSVTSSGITSSYSYYSGNNRVKSTVFSAGSTTKIQVQGASASDTVPTSWNTGITLASYTYAGSNGYQEKITYGNGAYVTYDYDRFGRLIGEEHYSSAGALQYRSSTSTTAMGILLFAGFWTAATT